MVAERLVLLDHLTKGRVIMGVGPGALPSDATMIGLKYGDLRDRMEEALEAIVALLTEEVTSTARRTGSSWLTHNCN